MKRLLLAALSCFCCIFFSQAQLRIAIVAGGHQADILEENNLPGFDQLSKGYSPRFGAHFGFVADLPFSITSKWHFQPGIIFFSKGRKFADSVINVNGHFYQSRKQFINYIDLPLNLVYKINLGRSSKFIFGGGPYASFFYNGKETSETIGENAFYELQENEDLPVGNEPGKYRVLNVGINALAGFEFPKVFITANYYRGLNDSYEDKAYAGSFKHQLFGGTLGIFIGKPVTMEEKTKDRDKDGIEDDKDLCPTLAGPALTQGCPDKDADGIADKDDLCPEQPGSAANKGCPILDKDGDGINDDKDKCPELAGFARYEGCPIPDKDGDGINDEEDKCPEVAGLSRLAGCPVPDTDGDGINDENDNCPQVKGLAANNGCPEIKKEIIEKVNYAAKRIQFKANKSDLLPESFAVLDEVASLLRQNVELKLAIEGHTSADGSLDFNMKLSQARADKVKAYLETKGINASRLSAIGFGPNQPLNEGGTLQQRAQNRRVELKLSN